MKNCKLKFKIAALDQSIKFQTGPRITVVGDIETNLEPKEATSFFN